MPRPNSEEVVFHDVSACFSEEEWKLLHEWQKELYRNVMKEIHQALTSLGPLIATTVFKLSAKETQEVVVTDQEHTLQRHATHDSPGDVILTRPGMLLRIHTDEELCPKSDLATHGREKNHCRIPEMCLSKEEEPVPIFIDHLGAEVTDGSADRDSGHEIVSFRIKNEEETYCMDYKDSTIRSTSISTGDCVLTRKVKRGNSVKNTDKTTQYKAFSDDAKLKMPCKRDEEGMYYRSRSWPEITQELERDAAAQCETDFSNQANLHVQQLTTKETRSEKYTDWESQGNLPKCPPDIEHSWRQYSFKCEKTISKKDNISRQKMTPIVLKPYQCTECEKSFSKKANLFVHRRTHTGERPYRCTICQRSFSQKGVLNRHHRTHTGEKPYQCAACEKSFSQKGDLIAHQKKHNRLSDYQTTGKVSTRNIPGSFSVIRTLLPGPKPTEQYH
ncbi:zinc finger protein 684-like [Ambystoma mexicanum]|uniref:zinc finger protein 684-like n=1 Tax=Ambystoma mexicanum TaxID=8296 RepID=UPI0037E878B0